MILDPLVLNLQALDLLLRLLQLPLHAALLDLKVLNPTLVGSDLPRPWGLQNSCRLPTGLADAFHLNILLDARVQEIPSGKPVGR